MSNRDMNFFMQEESEREEVSIDGISKFKYPKGHAEEGKIIPWILKPITTDRLEQLNKNNTTIKRISGKQIKSIDDSRLTYEMMVESIVYPNFKDENWLNSRKCLDPVDLMKKVLDLPGDYSRISKEVLAVNGLGEKDSEEALIKDAKN